MATKTAPRPTPPRNPRSTSPAVAKRAAADAAKKPLTLADHEQRIAALEQTLARMQLLVARLIIQDPQMQQMQIANVVNAMNGTVPIPPGAPAAVPDPVPSNSQ